MERLDPRERYDDLVVRRERHAVDAERFAELRESEVFQSGWGVAGVVFEGERLLAIRNEAYPTEWTLPGGAVEPGEGLADAVGREVREETGVEVEPVRPVGVDENVVVCEDDADGDETDGDDAGSDDASGDRRVEMAFVHFLCHATDPAVGEGDLGDPDETITEAAWLGSLPDDVFNPEHTRGVYDRARELRER